MVFRINVIVIILMLGIKSQAQKLKPLRIGDVVPDIEFQLMNSYNKTVKLSEYKGKLVILDFWATWCSGCISGFLKADTLQKKFGNEIQILLVNSSNRTKADSREKLNEFYKKWIQRFPNFKLPIAIEDKVAYSLFLHEAIPHYVWVSPKGIMFAATSSNDLTEENIKKYLADEKVEMSVQDGYLMDALYIDGVVPVTLAEIDNYSFFKKGEISNVKKLDMKRGVRIEKEFVTTRNVPLVAIYRRAIVLKRGFNFPDKRILIEVADTLTMNADLYSYELKVPVSQSPNIYNIMIDELNRSNDYIAGIEKRRVKTLVVIRTSNKDRLKASDKKYGIKLKETDNSKYIYNRELSYIINDLESMQSIKMPILDETNYTGKVDMEFSYYGDDIQKLRKELQKYDLDLIEAEREIEMFVIRDKPKPKTTTNNE